MCPAGQKSRTSAKSNSTTEPTQRAMRSPAAIAVFVLIAAGGLAADLLTKAAVFDSLLDDHAIPEHVEQIEARFEDDIEPDMMLNMLRIRHEVGAGVKFTLSTNPGVVFGLPMPRWAVATATVITVALIVGFFATSGARARSVHVALGCILGGALGNLYDRLLGVVEVPGSGEIRHQVRDFLDFSAWHYPWIFNVADVLLVVGVAIMAIHLIAEGRRGPDEA